MPDLANRTAHERALADAIAPVFLAIAAQGDRPDWEGAKRDLVSSIEWRLADIDYNARLAMALPGVVVERRDSAASAHEQAIILAAELIATRKAEWQAAREEAAKIKPPEGEEELSTDLAMLYLLYGLPKRTLFPVSSMPGLSPDLRNRLVAMERHELSASWEEHLAKYVPYEGRGLAERWLGSQAQEDIAVTETTKASSKAERAAAEDFERATGTRILAYWYTADDDRVCPLCGPLHAKAEQVWLREFPDGPPAHPRCRCWLTWKGEGE